MHSKPIAVSSGSSVLFRCGAVAALFALSGSTGLTAEEGRADKGQRIRVLIQTEKGDVEVELEPARAPVTVANLLRYADAKFYDGGRFHRTVKPDNQPDNK